MRTPASPEPRTHALHEANMDDPSRVVLPPLSVLLSLIPPRIPPEPHVTLSLLGAERSQLSDTALGELDMKLCVSRVRQSPMKLIFSC